ncbi:SET domain-containing protein SmydA-8-like [Phlebotomus argentipes]|uniref:SET domain-containing protein SmydA-8-like n=1 Tax=Phlebotomus argentipes TaxID=94469 RepID=UPI0028937802|nr:SET domain-containing protein SmydA-8-like [Phlebotomus argentipes]
MPSINLCPVCGVEAFLKCAGCKNVVYCGKDHQKIHWRKGHKVMCKCFELKVDEVMGRYLVATRDIKQGEVILKERPMVIGPKINSRVLCLGCHRFLSLQPKQKNYYKCSQCNWPLCGASCEQSFVHQAECSLMASRKFKAQINASPGDENKREAAYCAIVPLRCCLLKQSDPLDFERMLDLQSHLERRIDTPLYRILKANLLTFIRTILKVDIDEETVMKIAAILDTNTFEIRHQHRNIKIRGLYPTAAMISHSCVPNTAHTFSEDFDFILIATVAITKGSPIFTTYGQTLEATLQRREHLRQNKFFDCFCERCGDPTELSTFAGSFICSKCNSGKMIPMNPFEDAAPWKCSACELTIPAQQVIKGNKAIQMEIAALDQHSPKEFEAFLIKYRDVLHGTNTHMLQVKYALSQLYGNIPGYFPAELSDAALIRKIDICRELLEVGNLVEPGLSFFRGYLLMDLQTVLAIQAKRDFDNKSANREQTLSKLSDAMDLLQEGVKILSPNPALKDYVNEKVQELTNWMQF